MLIHGNAGDRRHWDFQFDELAAAFRVLRYDVRGFGRSPTPSGRYTDHDDLAALLDAVGFEKAHVVGWSMGAGIAIDFAMAYPGRTASVVAVGPWVNGHASPLVDAFLERLRKVARTVRAEGPGAGADAFMRYVLADTVCDDAAADFVRRIAGEYSWWAMSNRSPRAALEPSAASRLDRLAAPTLAVTAEYDLDVFRETARLIDSAVPDSRCVTMGGTGHLMHIEKAAEFNALLTKFLRSSPAA